ncbi:MAG TPA: 6-phosphofructokinase [Firmicutes bacterium]|mgnify:FL=1|nr:6-phosphofructokinase [Bacillota bacterium]
MVKKIGILTSGGDAPGMNDALFGAIRTCFKLNKEIYAIYNGYKGLIEDKIVKLDKNFADTLLNRGGTAIKTARLPEFKEDKVQYQAIETLKKHGIEALIVIGGDGSYMGAKKLTEKGINCIGLPGTIDNDIASSEITIGFDTALNTVVEAVDKIVDTSSSHNRCAVVEIMGNKCPDLTLFAGIATGANYILTCDSDVNIDKMISELKELKKTNPDHVLILVAEKLLDTKALADRIMNEVGFDTRETVLGHIQRGGTPTAMERVNSIRMGSYAVELLDEGIGGVCIGTDGTKLVYTDIYDALKLPRNKHEDFYHVHDLIK